MNLRERDCNIETFTANAIHFNLKLSHKRERKRVRERGFMNVAS